MLLSLLNHGQETSLQRAQIKVDRHSDEPVWTRAGKAALQDYQNQNARASRAPLEHELLLALALSGPIILSGTAHASVYTASRTMNSSGDGGSGCGGGGGGGGCGGCS